MPMEMKENEGRKLYIIYYFCLNTCIEKLNI